VSLSDDGTVVAVGAYDNSDGGALRSVGHVRVFRWNAGTSVWNQLGADLVGDEAGEYFGRSVSLSDDGTVLAAAGFLNDVGGDDAGHVKVFKLSGDTTTWTQLGAALVGDGVRDHFGHHLSLSGDGTTVAVGADGNDANGINSGHVRVYWWDAGNTVWDQLGADIEGEAAGDRSGVAVSLSDDGTVVAVGADKASDETGSRTGHVRVYYYACDTWTQMGTDVDGETVEDFGNSVSLNDAGTILAVGAPLNEEGKTVSGSGNLFRNTGSVRVYWWNSDTDTWDKLTTDFIGGDIEGDFIDPNDPVVDSVDGSLISMDRFDVSFGWRLGYYPDSVVLTGDGTALAVGGPGWVDPDTFDPNDTKPTGFARTYPLPATPSVTATPVAEAVCGPG